MVSSSFFVGKITAILGIASCIFIQLMKVLHTFKILVN
jgi:hypothetical protein